MMSNIKKLKEDTLKEFLEKSFLLNITLLNTKKNTFPEFNTIPLKNKYPLPKPFKSPFKELNTLPKKELNTLPNPNKFPELNTMKLNTK